MFIERLKLKNYRNYKEEVFDFSDGLNVIIGKNAQGKTNVLEAIFFSVIGKSFKTNKEKELIKWGENNSQIEGIFKRKYRDVKIEVLFDRNIKKNIKIDGLSIKRTGELLGHVNAVFFSPDELKLIKESPEERRRFLNIAISQTNKRYFYLLGRYEKVLANRNKLLKTSKDIKTLKETIDIWDRSLCDISEKIAKEREEFVKSLSPLAKMAHSYISSGKEDLEIKYNTFEVEGDYKSSLLKTLQKNLNKDFKLGYTTVGVHRDDLDIYLNGVEVKNFGSQGQQRTVSLSLKLAELEIIKNRTGEYPILLLDDVLSELDSERRKKLINFTSKTQTILTCTEFDQEVKNYKKIEIENGKIKNK